ncbi:BTAD domain-containing putative transcriptional regulator [Amycolatopsis sp. GA6-003]|uniref:BTAD domain-containing putative transcriptional regulator n=1 Tax=Amycolatopsis sp. GA6-003 TaxID=2652444 RepID=UPI0039173210
MLWDNPPETALRQIQTKVWKIRDLMDRAFRGTEPGGRPKLINQAGGYLLFVGPEHIDLDLVRRMVTDARAATTANQLTKAAERYQAGLTLWRGPAFADVTAPGVRLEAIRLAEYRMFILEERLDVELRLGRHADIIAELDELVRAHPLRGRLRLHLIRALGAMGRRRDAAEVYRDGYRVLVQELGLEPSRELSEAYRAVLAGDPLGPPPIARIITPRTVGGLDATHTAMPSSSTSTAPVELITHLPDHSTMPPPDHLEPILRQLLSGATDLTASRRLGLSPRTFSRRVSELLDYLGVESRFQAGVEASKRGWVLRENHHDSETPALSERR